MLGVGVFTISGLIVERLVVTDRKAIERTIDSAVDAILANDLDRLLDCVSPTAEQTRVEARLVFSRVEVTSVHLLNVEITIDYKSRPYTARVRFSGHRPVRDRRGEIPYQGFNEKATVRCGSRVSAGWCSPTTWTASASSADRSQPAACRCPPQHADNAVLGTPYPVLRTLNSVLSTPYSSEKVALSRVLHPEPEGPYIHSPRRSAQP